MADEIIDAQLVPDPVEDGRPVGWREWFAVLAVVALADATIYRGQGYAGGALLLVAAPLLLCFGAPTLMHMDRQRCWKGLLIVGMLLLVLAINMLWCGWGLHVFLGVVLLGAFAAALSGTVPYVLEIAAFPSRLVLGGMLGVAAYVRALRWPRLGMARFGCLSVVLPALALFAFGTLFVLANPDLKSMLTGRWELIARAIEQWISEFSPPATEFAFWFAAAWIAIGLLRPVLSRPLLAEREAREQVTKQVPAGRSRSPHYAAARNTLLAVVLLFAGYLVFEFATLWFREFPEGFYYSGYAHQGAFWLTVALALATFLLSFIFRGALLHDPRIRLLRLYAALWSMENLLLALAVYNRLYIYVGFNGMTRMRVVGLLGISSVLVGFLLVLWKITRSRGFLWLMRRHLWTVSLAIYLYGVLPVDWIVMDYNVRRIMTGDSAPAVQITEHEVSAEGVLLLAPLLDCEDALVREGIRAYLAERHEQAELLQTRRLHQGWTSFQYADHLLLRQLRGLSNQLAPYRETSVRRQVYDKFRQYAYQWY